jgi:hypothetical protein
VKFPTSVPPSPTAQRALIALTAFAVGFAAATEAPEMPTLRQGLWNYQRVSETPGRQPVSKSKCVDPSADLKKNLEQLRARNCAVSAIAQRNACAWTVACPVNGETLQIRSVITLENDTAFREETSWPFSQDRPQLGFFFPLRTSWANGIAALASKPTIACVMTSSMIVKSRVRIRITAE